MNCKRIEELIITDYCDGNLKGRALEEVESHLVSCTNCLRLAQEVKSASKLFRGALERQDPPGYLWRRVRDEISANPVRVHYTESVFGRLRYSLSHSRPAFVMASAAVMILFVLTITRLMPHKDRLETTAAEDDILTMTSYSNGQEEESSYDFGTAAERYFL